MAKQKSPIPAGVGLFLFRLAFSSQLSASMELNADS